MFRFLVIAVAFLLSLFTTISLPNFSTLDIGNIEFKNGDLGVAGTNKIRFGTWSFCSDLNSTISNPCDSTFPCNTTELLSTRFCSPQEYGYEFRLLAIQSDIAPSPEVRITQAWTRGLAIHASFTIMLFLSMLPAGSYHWFNFLTALIGFISIIIDVAFVNHVQSVMKRVGIAHNVRIGVGSIFMIISFTFAFVYFITTPNRTEGTFLSTTLSRLRSFSSRFSWSSIKSIARRSHGKPVLPTCSQTRISSPLPLQHRETSPLSPWVRTQYAITEPHISGPVLVSQRSSTSSSDPTVHMPGSFGSSLKPPKPIHSLSRHSSMTSISSVDHAKGGATCPLCLHSRTVNLCSTACGHVFCTPCLTKVLERGTQSRCPICRRQISKEEVRPIFLSV